MVASRSKIPVDAASDAPTQQDEQQMRSDGPEPMTMCMMGVSQRIAYPGKLALQKRTAEHEVEASQASLDAARRQLVRDVKAAFYQIAFIDQAFAIVERNRDVLAGLITISTSRYSVGAAGQQEVLRLAARSAGGYFARGGVGVVGDDALHILAVGSKSGRLTAPLTRRTAGSGDWREP